MNCLHKSVFGAAGAAALWLVLLSSPGRAAAQTCAVDFSLSECNTYQQVTADDVNHTSGYSCSATSYSGAEVTYEVTPPAGQEVVAFIESAQQSTNLDLTVESGDCGSAGTCVGSSTDPANTEEVTWTADGSTYYVSVDDENGLAGFPFTFSLGCPTDCDPATDVVSTISCSTDIMETTAGGTTALDYYTCGEPFSHLAQPNQESIYAFTPQQSGEVTFTLDNLTNDQDLYVLEGSCGPGACIASSTDLSTNVDSVTFQAQAGSVYYIVVEAFGGPATYDLAFAVGPGGGCPEDCNNGEDDDGDGDTDCDDQDCLTDPVCCDTDGDGSFGPLCGGDDCDDEDPTSFPGAEELCDGVDNDCDMQMDEGDACAADAGPGSPDAGSLADAGLPGAPDASGPATPDAGFGAGGDAGLGSPDGGGCGCRAGSASSGAAPSALLLLLGAALLRRRRRVAPRWRR